MSRTVADVIARGERALLQLNKKGREAPHTGISDGHASVVSITASDLRVLLEAARAAERVNHVFAASEQS
jgi:hypothetical protein